MRILKYISAAALSGNISDGLLYLIVESKTKLRTASLNPRKSHKISIEITITNTIDPIRPIRKLSLVAIPFSLYLGVIEENKSQAEITTVNPVKMSSPSEELNPKIKGEAYKFGLTCPRHRC